VRDWPANPSKLEPAELQQALKALFDLAAEHARHGNSRYVSAVMGDTKVSAKFVIRGLSRVELLLVAKEVRITAADQRAIEQALSLQPDWFKAEVLPLWGNAQGVCLTVYRYALKHHPTPSRVGHS